jgi:hypothetical protein
LNGVDYHGTVAFVKLGVDRHVVDETDFSEL